MKWRLAFFALAIGCFGKCACSDQVGTGREGESESEGESEAESESEAEGEGELELTLVEFVKGLSSPVDIQTPPGDDRLFVVEQGGIIRIVQKDGAVVPTAFLDIADRISAGGERGLLGLAFHPNYATDGRFFVDYTDLSGNTHISQLFVSSKDKNQADPDSEDVLLEIIQPAANHNGGQVAFGPDGFLYIGMGDGGGGCDNFGNGQNMDSFLAKLLRIDVDSGDPYAIPEGNPFGDEIWAWGLRNPWRFSFDRAAGDLYIGDVGQNRLEEIDFQPASSAGGENYGWPRFEGSACQKSGSVSCPGMTRNCKTTGLVAPIFEYTHSDKACSITGGYVYRGKRIPALAGHYFYADYCAGWIRSFRYDGAVTEERTWDFPPKLAVSTFGQDSSGELYVADLYAGVIYRIEPK